MAQLHEEIAQRPLRPAAEQREAAAATIALGRGEAIADRPQRLEMAVRLLGPDGDPLVAEVN